MAGVPSSIPNVPSDESRGRAIPFYPVLFAIYPILGLYTANVALAEPRELASPILLAAGASAVLTVAIRLFSKSWRRAALYSAIVVALVYSYRFLHGLFAENWVDLAREMPVAEWPFRLVLLCIAFLAGHFAGGLRRFSVFGTKLLNFISLALCASATVGIMVARSKLPPPVVVPKLGIALDRVWEDDPPDVYYILLDGFGREDALRRYIGIDTSRFVSELRKRGFKVASDSVTNYDQTQLSLSSTLNMEFVPKLFGKSEEPTREALSKMIIESRVARSFREMGYRYVCVSSGVKFLDGSSADLYIKKGRSRFSEFEAGILELTPFAIRGGFLLEAAAAKRTHVRYALSSLGDVPNQIRGPRFVYAHIISPHPPFVFYEDGSDRKPPWTGLEDGRLLDIGITLEEYQSGYGGQALYTAKLTIDAVDRILRNDPDAIIVIQGDHGPKAHHGEDLKTTVLSESFPILNAYHVPKVIADKIDEGITPINSFRVILSELSNRDFDRLPDRSFFAPWKRPFDFTDVTDKLAKEVDSLRAHQKTMSKATIP